MFIFYNLMSRSAVFIQLIYYLCYQNYIGKLRTCIFACKILSTFKVRQFYSAVKARYLL